MNTLSLFPAKAESQYRVDESATLSAVEQALSARGIPWKERPLLSTTGGFGTSLVIDFPGTDKNAGNLYFATPLERRGVGADLSYGQETLIELATSMKASSPAVSTTLAFLADESSELPADLRGPTLRGLADLSSLMPAPEHSALIYLDLPQGPGPVVIHHGTSLSVAPLKILRPMLEALQANRISSTIAFPFNDLFRLGLVEGPRSLEFLSKRGVSALQIGMRDGQGIFPGPSRYFHPEPGATGVAPAVLARCLLSFQEDLTGGIPTESDRRYSLISFFGWTLVISEGMSVSIVLLFAGTVLAYLLINSIIRRKRLKERSRLLLRRLWIIPVMFALIFFGERFGEVLILRLLSLLGRPEAWKAAPYGAVVLKLITAIAVVVVSETFAFRFGRRYEHVYGNAALACLVIGFGVSTVADITFMPQFLWAFAFAFVAATAQTRLVAVLAVCIAPLRIIISGLAAVGTGNVALALWMFQGGLRQDFFIALVMLPFALLASRVFLMGNMYSIRRPGDLSVRFLVLLCAVLASVAYALRAPSPLGRPLKLSIRETVGDEGGSIAYLDDYQRSTVFLDTKDGQKLRLPTDYSLGGSPTLVPARPIHLQGTWTRFLDRVQVELTVSAEGQVGRIDLFAEADESFSVHDCNFPFTRSADSKSVSLIIGERPELPLKVLMVLPAGIHYRFTAAGVWTTPFSALTISPPRPFDYALTAHTIFETDH